MVYLALVKIARHEHVRKRKRVRAGDLNLTLDAYVPQRHSIEKLPILCDGIAIVTRVVHVVIHAVHRHAVAARTVEEASKLIEVGFDYVTEIDGVKLFRKRK